MTFPDGRYHGTVFGRHLVAAEMGRARRHRQLLVPPSLRGDPRRRGRARRSRRPGRWSRRPCWPMPQSPASTTCTSRPATCRSRRRSTPETLAPGGRSASASPGAIPGRPAPSTASMVAGHRPRRTTSRAGSRRPRDWVTRSCASRWAVAGVARHGARGGAGRPARSRPPAGRRSGPREVGLRLAIENHGDLRAEDLLEVIERVGSPNLGVTLDNVNLIRVGDDMIEGTRMLASRTLLVQLKDHPPTPRPARDGRARSRWRWARGVATCSGELLGDLRRRPATTAPCAWSSPRSARDCG